MHHLAQCFMNEPSKKILGGNFMKKLAFASAALAGAIALSGCKTEEKTPAEVTGLSQEEIAAQEQATMQTRLDNYLIPVNDIPVTRNGEEFTISTLAYCNSLEEGDVAAYTSACAEIATQTIQTQFLCAGYSLPMAMTRTYDEEILKIGVQGRYDPRYLYTEERLIEAIQKNENRLIPDDIVILTEISDMDAAKRTYIREGDKPEICPQ